MKNNNYLLLVIITAIINITIKLILMILFPDAVPHLSVWGICRGSPASQMFLGLMDGSNDRLHCFRFLSHLTCLHKLELWFDALAQHMTFSEDEYFNIRNENVLLVC